MTTESQVRAARLAAGNRATYKMVDTCAAEFEAYTPYYYSTYGEENERRESGKRKVIILGGGPNRVGQGIEFDYCCVHAAFALRELGYETIEWVDLRVESNEQRELVRKCLVNIHVPGITTSEGFRIFGWLESGVHVEYIA